MQRLQAMLALEGQFKNLVHNALKYPACLDAINARFRPSLPETVQEEITRIFSGSMDDNGAARILALLNQGGADAAKDS